MTSSSSSSARLRLLTGPAGSGKTHRVLERIRDAATTLGPRGRGGLVADEALLILPTYAQVTRARRVALSRWDARGLFDAPFTTFTGAGERFLGSFRVRTLPSTDERDRLMEEALRRAAARSSACRVFDEVADRPGFRERLLRLVKEAKQTGLSPEDLRARFARASAALEPGPRERIAAFRDVFEAYEGLLREAGLEDHEDALRRLLEQARAGSPERVPNVLAVDGFDDFTAVEESILHALAKGIADRGGEVLVTLPWDDARPHLFEAARTARERFLARGFVEERLGGFPRAPGGALAALARGLFGERGAPVPAGEEVRLVLAADPEDEAEAVAREARRVVREGTVARGWRDVAVVVRSLRDDAPRYGAALERLGIPVRLVAAARPLAAEALVRSLRGPLRVLGGGMEAGDFDPQEIVAWARWSAHAAGDARLLAAADRAEIAWRANGWPAGWRAFREGAPAAMTAALSTLEDARRRVAAANGAGSVCDRLLEALPALAPLPRPAGFDAEGRPFDAENDARVARAAAAYARLRDIVRSMAEAARRTRLGGTDGAAETLADLRDLVERATFSVPDPRLDAVSLLDAEEARSWEMPVVIVAGLSAESFPRRPREDPLLDDEAREALRRGEPDLGLPLARERETRERRLFYGAMTRARKRLLLVRPTHDAAGGPLEPSMFLRDVARVVSLPEPRPRPLGAVAPPLAECFTRRDLALFAASRARRASDTDEKRLAQALLRLVGSTAASRARRWVRRTADRLDAAPGVLERFRASVDVVSATTLNRAVRCRHSHFLATVIGVPRDEVPFGGPALDGLLRGRLLHEALRVAVSEPARPAEEVADGVVRSVLDGAAVPEVDRSLLGAEVARVVRLWRERETATAGGFRAGKDGLEWSFGREGPPVVLGSGDDLVRLRGAIDRIDVSNGSAIVMDYKSSPDAAKEACKAARAGEDLQLPLYAVAVERLLGKRVVGLEWVAITRRARFGVWGGEPGEVPPSRGEARATAVDPTALESVRRVAEEAACRVVGEVRRGIHAKRAGDPETCGGCEWRAVCRPLLRRAPAPAVEPALACGGPT